MLPLRALLIYRAMLSGSLTDIQIYKINHTLSVSKSDTREPSLLKFISQLLYD